MWTEATWPGFRPLWKKNIFTLQCISSLLLATPWSSYVNLIHLILSSWHTPTPRKKRCECKKILNLHSDHVNSIQLVAWDRFKLAIPPAKQLVWSPWCHSPGMDISSVPRHRKVAQSMAVASLAFEPKELPGLPHRLTIYEFEIVHGWNWNEYEWNLFFLLVLLLQSFLIADSV